jgi:hypothetical protein
MIRTPVGLDLSDMNEIQKIHKENPTLPYYFCERIYRYIKFNPEEAQAVAEGKITLPIYDRSEAFVNDEEKLKLREEYQSKCLKAIGNAY